MNSARTTPPGGPVAVITGGSRGIGLEVARHLGSRGFRLLLIARNPEDLARARLELESAGASCSVTTADVAEPAAVDAALAAAEREFAVPDLVIHCAGVLEAGLYDDLPAEAYRRTMEINYLGSVHVARAALRRMLERGSGHLVQVASVIAIRSFPGFAAYAPTKWALRAFHETLEAELAGAPVHLSLVYPPITDTPMVRDLPESSRPAVYRAFRAVPPDRVAGAIVRGVLARRRRIFARRTDWLYFHLARLAPGTVGRVLDARVARSARPATAGARRAR